VALDLHQLFGIDLEDLELLRARSWPWLERRFFGLLSCRSRTLWAYQKADHDKIRERMSEGANPLPWL
jgi:hypothetical protein